jgi:RimJ/RimL family protein N-acetyltransferase
MELIPLDDRLIEIAAGWLGEERNYQWLDFGMGTQKINAALLKIMTLKDSNIIRAFTSDDEGKPIGLVALSSVNRDFKTAVLWVVLGDRRYSAKGYAHRSTAAMLTLGFTTYGLECVNAWAVECNHASLRALRKLHFRPIGRQRSCHYIDGKPYDRLWFDLLASEHRETNDVHARAIAR